MQKAILITVDDSRHSLNAVDYAIEIRSFLNDVKFTLMHVQPTISGYLLDEAKKSPAAYAELEEVNRKNAEAAQELLKKYLKRMTAAGIAESDLELNTQPRMLGVAKDIL